MKEAQRIRITEPGWGGYTGPISNVMFEDAISVEPVSPQVAHMIGALIRIEACDDDKQVGAGAQIVDLHEASADNLETLVAADPTLATPTASEKKTYTREELAAIADSRGVVGLREIATPLGASGRGIVELIERILAKQGV